MKSHFQNAKYFLIFFIIVIVVVILRLELNIAPKINPIPNTTIKVGETYKATGTFIDPDSSSWKAYYSFSDKDYNVPELKLNSNKTFTVKHQFNNIGKYTLFVIIIDSHGAIGSTTSNITVISK